MIVEERDRVLTLTERVAPHLRGAPRLRISASSARHSRRPCCGGRCALFTRHAILSCTANVRGRDIERGL